MNFFNNLEELPPDPLFGIQRAYEEDKRPTKVNLSIGTYKTDELKPYILPSVKRAEEALFQQEMSKDYLPILGLHSFIQGTKELIFGKNPSDIFGAQTVGGTSALCIAANLLYKAGHHKIYISDPTWGNHPHIFKEAGMEVERYHYFDKIKPFESMEEGSVLLLQPCCHNPTGCDYSKEEWVELFEIIKTRKLLPIFDIAYQGFGDGVEADAQVVRNFADLGLSFMVAASYSKNFGLYRERVGAFFMKHHDVKRLTTQLSMAIRGIYSNPPAHGAEIVAHILMTAELKKQWLFELEEMRKRILSMRGLLVRELKGFEFMLEQKGMFSYTKLKREQVLSLRDEFGIYMTLDGRINVAGLNPKNIGYVSKAILSLRRHDE